MQKDRKIAVIGLGYVGLAVAVGFGKKYKVIGFDVKKQRIQELKKYYDRNQDCSKEDIRQADIEYTTDTENLKKADFFIITVPTPIDSTHNPDFIPLISASEIVGKYLKKGDIVVYESTVYPGATEEICIPVLENVSKKTAGKDFFVGYSPERVNPGDTKHQFTNTIKIVSAQDKKTLDIISNVYGSVVTAGLFPTSSIKIAEAAKVIENTQRDLNISLMNEIALIMHRIGINTLEVLQAAETKWNFLPFRPGLVGGHCIGVDPYYLTHKAQKLGYQPEVILSGRRINDSMGKFIAEQTVKKLIEHDLRVKKARVAILGVTFKENCSDLRNSRVFDLVDELKTYDSEIYIHDPLAHADELKSYHNLTLTKWDDLAYMDAIIIAVAHDFYKQLSPQEIESKFAGKGIIMDVKGIVKNNKKFKSNIDIWQL